MTTAAVRSPHKENPVLKFAFLSSTCPAWTFEEMVDGAKRLGYEGIDLRVEWGHNHHIELDSPAERRREARRYAADHGIAISCVAVSARFARATDQERHASVEDVKRYAALAADLGSPLLRVFGGNLPEGHTMADLKAKTAEALGEAAAAAAPFGVVPCLETHDQHNNPDDVAWIVEHAGHENVGVVWHPAHHLRLGISVDEAYPKIRKWVRHLHLQEWPKGGVKPGERPNFLRFGEGDDHLLRVFQLLERDGFDGYASNEWAATGAWQKADPNSPEHYAARHPDESLGAAARQLHAWRTAAQKAA
jgi:sugar phosphate isomerase/epimerase